MKQKNYQRWSRPLLLTLLSIFMAFSGASSVWADTLTENFNSVTVAIYSPYAVRFQTYIGTSLNFR